MFGEFIKTKRLEKRLGLREFCKKYQHDPSNWSKIERGELSPPKDENLLKVWAANLELKEGSADWFTFFDLAATENGRIPQDILDDRAVAIKLPLFFRTIRGQKPTLQELESIIKIVRQG
jgi:transcriptional regulator with XRE-family HTH domain